MTKKGRFGTLFLRNFILTPLELKTRNSRYTVLPPLTNLIHAKKVFVSGNVLKLDLGGPLRTYFVLKSEKGPLPYV